MKIKLAIDLGGTNIRIGQVANGIILNKQSVSCPAQKDEAEVLAQLCLLIREMNSDAVTGIGIGVPSVVDSERGIVYNAANIASWKEVHLKDILQKEFRLPVAVNNDSNCFALGEHLFGEGTSYKDMVGITLGTGVGAGIVVDGKLYCGRNTGAGEVGSLPYLDADYEQYCSSGFFVKHHRTTAKEAAESARKGDARALAIWHDFGRHLGQLFKAVLFAYDPEAIVIGGGIAAAYPLCESAVREAMSDFPYPAMLQRLHIRTTRQADISLLGASALVDD